MTRGKAGAFIALVMLAIFAAAGISNAAVGTPLAVSVTEVKVNGDVLTEDEVTRTNIERDGTVDIKVSLRSYNTTLENVEITAFISGYEYNSYKDEQLSATTAPFDVNPDVVYTKSLRIKLPELMQKDDYKLRIVVTDRYGKAEIYNYNLEVAAPRHNIVIRDVVFSPDNEVMAGRALLSVVRIKNVGDKDEQGVKVKVSIPELGISASQYIDELDADKSVSSEELYLRIPSCAKEGAYTADVTVDFDEGHGRTSKKETVYVAQDPTCKVAAPTDKKDGETGTTQPKDGKVVVTVIPTSQTVARGEGGAIYQLTLANEGTAAKTYAISVDGAESAFVTRVSPSAIVGLGANEQKTVYVYVTAKENAPSGTHALSISLKEGDKVVKQIAISAEVVEPAASADGLRTALEIGAIVLLVILVIAALVVGFNRLRGKKEEQEITQTYY